MLINLDRSGFKNQISKNLHYYIEEKKLKQKELSERAQIAPSVISSYLNADRVPTLPNAVRLCSALSITLDDLLFGSTNNNVNSVMYRDEKGTLFASFNNIDDINDKVKLSSDLFSNLDKILTASNSYVSDNSNFRLTDDNKKTIKRLIKAYLDVKDSDDHAGL